MIKSKQPNVSTEPLALADLRFEIKNYTSYIDKDSEYLEGPHIHDCFEIYMNISGDVSFLIDNNLYPVKRGELAFSKPNVFHHCVYNKSCTVEHFVLWIHAKEDSEIFHFTAKKNFSPLFSADEQTKNMLISLFYQLYAAYKSKAACAKLFQTAYLLQILSIINSGKNLFNIDETQLLPPDFNRLLTDIDKNFLNFHTAKDLAEHAFVSTATLNRWFKNYLQLSPKRYLEAKKLSYAKKLVAQGQSITEAGLNAGFYDASHFISIFKKNFGFTPFKYKKQR